MPYETNFWTRTATTLALVAACQVGSLAAQAPATVLTIHANQRLSTFRPERDWGAALDGHDLSETSTTFTRANIAAMKSAGFGPVTYRLRTELGIETWHWNPVGTWSDAAHHQGYWVSSPTSVKPINLSFGYRLPRRGRTIDDANNDGYSRLDDGDTNSFWKTNPYLDPRYTHDLEAEHAQWLALDLGELFPLQELELRWGAPFPRHYVVEYWEGDQTQLIDDNPQGKWRTFPHGLVSASPGGDARLRLSDTVMQIRFIRIVMTQSSHTAMGGNGDPRDSLGFALREIYAGVRDSTGRLHDLVRHDTAAAKQTVMLVSSTDPWHRATDADSGTAQPGLDLVLRSALTSKLPALVPTGLLFDTPENAANEVRFLRSRGYPIDGFELGEEPDGQRVTPEDYGSLYLQFAKAMHVANPAARLGGPSFQTLLNDPLTLWPDRASPGKRPSWIGRFLDYLDAHNRVQDYRFFSFEWYPFDNVCENPAPNVAAAPGMLARSLAGIRAGGLPDSIPRYMTEYGYSAHLSNAEVNLPSAVFDVDLVASFFLHGGTRSFYFGWEPGWLAHEPDCDHWGNLVMFLADSTGGVGYKLPRYYAARLLTHAWADSLGGPHFMYAINGVNRSDSLLSMFALQRPDHRWSVLLVNRDPSKTRTVDLRLQATAAGIARKLRGPLDIYQYSSEQYEFHEDGENGRPIRDLPPAHKRVPAAGMTTLPPYSVTVVVGS